MRIAAIDPGPSRSAYAVLWSADPDATCAALRVLTLPQWGLVINEQCRDSLMVNGLGEQIMADVLVIEQMENYGKYVGREVFDTVFWSGRFAEAWDGPHRLLPRRIVKRHLCGTVTAKDPQIRQALIDRFGGSTRAAIGLKKSPGPLYGIHADVWSALALAMTYADHAPLTAGQECLCGWMSTGKALHGIQ